MEIEVDSRLILGDCLDAMQGMSECSIDAIVTDRTEGKQCASVRKLSKGCPSGQG